MECEINNVHEDEVSYVKNKMLDDDSLFDVAELFKVFGDFTRIKILSCLELKELCVCDIASILNMTKSAVSHQLRILRQSALVKSRKSGKEVYYSLADFHVTKIFDCAIEHIKE